MNEPSTLWKTPGSERDADRAPTGAVASWILFWGVAVALVVLDQGAKFLALAGLDPARPVPILPGLFELRLVFNPGAAFSLFPGGRWLFILISMGAFFFIPWYLRGLLHQGVTGSISAIGLGLILGGAIGNAIDRLFRHEGLVVDFFHAFWNGHSFPVFNVADSAITIGIGSLILATLWAKPCPGGSREETGEKAEEERDVAGSL